MVLEYALSGAYILLMALVALFVWLACDEAGVTWLKGFFATPVALAAVHTVGDCMQTLNLGPEWVQNHLHNLGVCGLATLLSLAGNKKRLSIKVIQVLMRRMSIVAVALTILAILYEILLVTTLKQSSVAKGYSGSLDWIDISAYLVGLALMLANHFAFWFFKLRK